ncbi:tumor necrosis factor receptor superfamily member 6 isoform 2-T2 [Anomaloglossus baeobatrachus]|uniref:tumor necrosis factor receptor superfamily member 6 isoform X2 n=1 Tax=Anomaloglossus baeobatrachus TaxID=238106 RepID=UPI003F50C81C
MVWGELDCRVKAKGPTSANHLWKLLQDFWKTISGDYLLKLIKRMQRVCKVVIKAKALEKLSACTLTRDTVCKCREDFFCAENITTESNGCHRCQHCKECPHSHANRCSSIKNTVCYNPRQRYYMIAYLVPLVVLISLICYFIMARNKAKEYRDPGPAEPNKGEENSVPTPELLPFIFPEYLKDIHLTKHLADFAENMDFTIVRDVVRKMEVPDTAVQDIIRDYHSDAKEQKFQLLKRWYEAHGKTDAFHYLIKSLQELSNQGTAEKLIEIVSRQHQHGQA